ncbi:MAG: VIT1/CCC1 family predicted Fe2+/Mn2+ transporter/rubrerythrin [Candidatus Latescibacterota bacterium]|jgi:VIT1/CCC1 family predicted Fe2+/Mn2+ transporter/rubrerythrin
MRVAVKQKHLLKERYMSSAPKPEMIAQWRHHLQDEADAAFLYRRLSDHEPNQKKKDLYWRMSDVEDRHTEAWRQVFKEYDIPFKEPRPSLKSRFLAWVGSHFGAEVLLSFLLREEGKEVKSYLELYQNSEPGRSKETALRLAKESAGHAETLSGIADIEGEPWHNADSGGFVRNVVYGFNDGLTANFGLVAGVIGAAVEPHMILVTGVAGTIADALSMGSSGYLAAKSEQEVYTYEIEMERTEIQLMPELETEELALIYQARGIDREQAEELAQDVMSDPERALEEKVREELKIGEPHATPMQEAWITGSATAVGAFIPVVPFLLMSGATAMWTSFAISMLSHFAVGAARSLFTGRSIFRSGGDMLVVGFGVALGGYLVGDLMVRWLM